MSAKETLTLDEFATAPRRQRPAAAVNPARAEIEHQADMEAVEPAAGAEPEKGETSSEASKALRQMKRVRMKGVSHFVNVHLDRDMKRRLKLASFNLDTSMQALSWRRPFDTIWTRTDSDYIWSSEGYAKNRVDIVSESLLGNTIVLALIFGVWSQIGDFPVSFGGLGQRAGSSEPDNGHQGRTDLHRQAWPCRNGRF